MKHSEEQKAVGSYWEQHDYLLKKLQENHDRNIRVIKETTKAFMKTTEEQNMVGWEGDFRKEVIIPHNALIITNPEAEAIIKSCKSFIHSLLQRAVREEREKQSKFILDILSEMVNTNEDKKFIIEKIRLFAAAFTHE